MTEQRASMNVVSSYQSLVRQVGIDADVAFEDPRVVVWRDITERQNCTLDETLADGRRVRLHVKRFKNPADGGAEEEVAGIRLLDSRGIGTVPLVAWGHAADGRGFVISEDLAGYEAGDTAVQRGLSLARLIEPVAAVAGRLHRSGLHHRDLYLCHFFVKADDAGAVADVRLIDAARVRELPRVCLRQRWIVKDLAQLVYSLRQVGASGELEQRALTTYARERGIKPTPRLGRQIERKVARIARHDLRLKRKQPDRNVSIAQ